MERNLKFVSNLQAIAIILVVAGHSLHQYPDGANGEHTLAYRLIYSFHVPLFMFVSGFLLDYSTSRRPRTWLRLAREKFRRLMVPFFVLSVVTFLPRAAMSGFADEAVELSAGSLADSLIRGDRLVIPFLWFLQSLFTLLVTVYGAATVSRMWRVPPVVCYLVIFAVVVAINLSPADPGTFFSLNTTVRMATYFMLGCLYSRMQSSVDRIVAWSRPATFLLFAALWIATALAAPDTYPADVLTAAAGIAMCVAASQAMVARRVNVFGHLDGANYIIFLLSWYFNVASQQLLARYVALPWWVHGALSLILGIYAPWALYRLMLRHPRSRATRALALVLGQRI